MERNNNPISMLQVKSVIPSFRLEIIHFVLVGVLPARIPPQVRAGQGGEDLRRVLVHLQGPARTGLGPRIRQVEEGSETGCC